MNCAVKTEGRTVSVWGALGQMSLKLSYEERMADERYIAVPAVLNLGF